MSNDPVIDEVRRVRREISAEFGHDTRRLVEHYQELQRKLKNRLESSADRTVSGLTKRSS